MQGTFLPAAKAADLDSMGCHTELLEAGQEIRRGIADLKSRNETPQGRLHRRSLERKTSISQAERRMFDFDRIVRVRPISACLVISRLRTSEFKVVTRKANIGALQHPAQGWVFAAWSDVSLCHSSP